MTKEKITTFFDYFEIIENIKLKNNDIILYRGQSEIRPLIPSVARKDSKINTSEIELNLLNELKRRSKTLITNQDFDDWDWLVYAQHFGLKTRLLDWSSNPLTALWFACSNLNKDENPVVYILKNAQDYLLDKTEDINPFDKSKTKVLKPSLNNQRIIAQSGWFTAHKYSESSKRFVDLTTNPLVHKNLIEVEIPKNLKTNLLDKLNLFGINYQTLFPDVSGLCNQLNWEFKI